MQWQSLDKSIPANGTTCVVARKINNGSKPLVGLWRYYSVGDESYWQTKHGKKITCSNYDHWCDVKEVISRVEEMIVDDVKSEMKMSRFSK